MLKKHSYILITRTPSAYTAESRIQESLKWFFFTDAPYDAEYETDMNRLYPCDTCGREQIKKALFAEGEKLICAEYFQRLYSGEGILF